MSLGVSISTVVVNGTYMDFQGVAIEGQIRFSMSEVLRDGTDDQMIAPSSVVVKLVDGAFSVTLPATNDPDIVPNPFVYTVEESFVGGRTYEITLPYTTVGSLDLADISPDPSIPTEYVQLVDATTWAAEVALIATLVSDVASESADFAALAAQLALAQGYASDADTYLTLATNNANGTLNPLLLIGG